MSRPHVRDSDDKVGGGEVTMEETGALPLDPPPLGAALLSCLVSWPGRGEGGGAAFQRNLRVAEIRCTEQSGPRDSAVTLALEALIQRGNTPTLSSLIDSFMTSLTSQVHIERLEWF